MSTKVGYFVPDKVNVAFAHASAAHARALAMQEPRHQRLAMEGKTSAAFRVGHAVNPHISHDDFLPLKLGIMALGNGFSGRLMHKVRDEAGLTYGIYASLRGGYNPCTTPQLHVRASLLQSQGLGTRQSHDF